MNKPQNLPVEGIPIKKSKIELYQDSLIKILSGLRHTNPAILFSNQLVKSSKVFVLEPMTGDRLRQLTDFGNSWNQELTIDPNPWSTIKIEFKLKEK